MAKPKEPGPWLLPRIAAVIVVFLTLTTCGLQAMGVIAAAQHPEIAGPAPSAWAVVVATGAGGLAAAVVLECFARLGMVLRRDQTIAAAPVADSSNGEIIDALARLETALPTALAESIAAVLPTAVPVDTAVSSGTVDEHLANVVRLLEEIKEVSMLDEAQRQARRQQQANRRKSSRLEEADRLITDRNWEQADALLTLLESLHPGDAEVLGRRNALDDTRGAQLAADWQQLARQVEDQMALGRFKEAADLVELFRQAYPNHAPGIDLADRVFRESEVYIERAVTRAFDEIRAFVEGRQWRVALQGTQRFLERFPDHPRSDKIRQQLRVIQKNAEIEERQEQEEQINNLIKSRRYTEALEVGEDLVARFPESPQAERMNELLPRLREKAAETDESIVP
jgi:hypothetical protein